MAEKQKAGGKGKKGAGKRGPANAIKVAADGETRVSPESGTPRLQKQYQETIVAKLTKDLSVKNAMEVPKVTKIVLNCGVNEAVGNPKVLDSAINDMSAVAGQKAVVTRARKSIATFKLREGAPIGTRVTLRRARMYEFLDRLINVTLPRVRDFKGLNTKFDGRGNYSIGLKEQIIFPEIDYDKVDSIRGLTVTVCTTAKTNEQARALLTEFGMPFKK